MMKKNKGAAMPVVFLIITVLVMMAAVLISYSFQGYKESMAFGNIDYAYAAGDASIEKSFDYIDKLCKNTNLASGITDTNNDVIAEQVIDRIAADMKGRFGKVVNGVTTISFDSDIADSGDLADTQITLKRLGQHNCSTPGHGDRLVITIGITAQSSYRNGLNSAANKTVFAKRDFEVCKPPRFYLQAPVYTIGDVMVDNKMNATVKGDVIAYGTSPEYAGQIEQYYYGGISARTQGKLNIQGNAVTRSFIRTGGYVPGDDNSEIRIYKDAIAGGIQVFDKGDRIVVYRNAYTFDDIEMNGENSVIAINGSCFAMSEGNGIHHDSSSAIINSATVHNLLSPESKKSRIVVNGDVFINGTTFKLDPGTGTAMGKIEDGSLAWSRSNDQPYYKDILDWSNPNNYHASIDSGNAKGFANLFQVWSPVNIADFANPATIEETNINNWLGNIESARKEGSNDKSKFGHTVKNYLSGICRHEIAANFTDEATNNPSIFKLGASPDQITMPKFGDFSYLIPDNVTYIDNTRGVRIQMPADFWDSYKNGSVTWDEYKSTLPIHTNAIYQKLSALKGYLMGLTEDFVKERNYDYTGTGKINHLMTGSPEAGFDNMFLYLANKLNGLSGSNIVRIGAIGSSSYAWNEPPHDLKDFIGGYMAAGSTSYKLVLNFDSNLILNVTGKFNGIIFSMGKVQISNGADITGSIIAAGRGSGSDAANGYISGSAAEDTGKVPRILQNGENKNAFDSGAYAGVHFKGTGTGTENSRITFPGRDDLFNSLNILDLDKYL